MTLLPVCRFTKEIDMAVLGSNNKSIKVNKSDLKYQLDMSLDNLGIGT